MRKQQVTCRSRRTQRLYRRLVALVLLCCGVAGLTTGKHRPVPAGDKPDSLSEGRPRLEVYPATPGAPREDRVMTTVQGCQLPLIARRIFHSDSTGKWFMEVAAGRFAANGPVTITLASVNGHLGQPVLRTVGRDLATKCDGDTATFELPGPGHYYLQLPELARPNGTFTVVFWVDDLHRLERTRAALRTSAALDVTMHGIEDDPLLDQTVAIQTLLDAGGTLCFPPGVYRTGTLHMRSDTTIFLAPGAVIRASEGEEAVGSEFIAIENARNVRLCGPGTVDAASRHPRRGHNVHNVNITSSQGVTFEDVLFEESNSWAVHIRRSDGFTAHNVRIFSGKDGFDPDASRDVVIDGAFVVSADDAIAVKNRFPEEPDGKTTQRVIFRNSIVSTPKSALKIGTETRGLIRDVTFENCDVFDGDRGIVLYARDGGPIEHVVWRNIRLFMHDWPQEKDSGTVFHLNIQRREAATPVRDCLIENVTANWLYRSEFAGLPDTPLEGLTMRNIRVTADPPKKGRPALFVCRDNVRISVQGLTVDWQGHEAQWAGIVSGDGLTVSDFSLLTDGCDTHNDDKGNTRP